VVCREHIHAAIMHTDAPLHAIEFAHGYTYSGHPVACAAAVATMDLFVQEDLLARAAAAGPLLGDAVHAAIKGLPNVVGIRSLGLAAAVELAPNPSAPGKKAYEVFLDCLAHGVLVRSAGDNLVLAPAYVVTPAQIAQMVDTLAAAIKRQA
jgi:beta-alanine--pyruvate transaminase